MSTCAEHRAGLHITPRVHVPLPIGSECRCGLQPGHPGECEQKR